MDAVAQDVGQSSSFRGLPLFLTRENKYAVGWVVIALGAAMYLGVNHYPLFEPRQLEFSWIDRAVPFLPNTVWLYMGEYLLFVVTYVASRDLTNLNRYLYAFLSMQTLACLIFLFWPTVYPRELFPLPADLNAITHYAFTSLRTTDAPTNCCPSLHVSSVYLASFIFIDERRKLFPGFFAWATVVAVSTLTTKQHYFIDVVAGLAMALVVYWVFFRWMKYRRAA